MPQPPRDLQIEVISGKAAQIEFQPPENGKVSGYRLLVSPLSELDETLNQQFNISANAEQYTIRDLVPGGHYEIQLYSILNGKLSTEFLATNFTTKPNVPGRFIVWYRNETTLLTLLQPPYPSGIFDHYKVRIEPGDSFQSEIQVSLRHLTSVLQRLAVQITDLPISKLINKFANFDFSFSVFR